MPKNIVICCDGTGNQFGRDNSNVVRLYTCLTVDDAQVAYYHPGVGTMGDPNHSWRIARWWSRVKGLAFGLGFADNLADAYRYLMDHYVTGDRIYLFGFSRGAYTVRALAGALNMYGLLCAGNEGHLRYLLQMLKSDSRKAFNRKARRRAQTFQETQESRAFRETFSRQVPIHFMGVWDTVSSIGWVFDPIKILYDGQNPCLRRGRQALSVDERRCFYQAMPWGDPLTKDQMQTMRQQILDDDWTHQDIVQAWFAGVHSDVGGSYRLCESAPAIDAFEWILAEAELDGVKIELEKRNAVMGLPSKFKAIEQWNSPQPIKGVCIHKSLRRAWWILEAFPHKYFDQQGTKRWQVEPWPHSREIPDGALMCPALRERLSDTKFDYHPKNLDPGRIRDFAAQDGPMLLPDAAQRLIAQRFGVYRAQSAV